MSDEIDLITEDIKKTYQTYIRSIKHQLGKDVTVYWDEGEVLCPNCYYDGINQCSTGRYKTGGPVPFSNNLCPVCKNKGRTINYGSMVIKASIYYPNLYEHDRQSIKFNVFDYSSVSISCLLEDCYIKTGKYANMLVWDVVDHVVFDNVTWLLDGRPIYDGLGEKFVVEVKLKAGNKPK